MGVEEKPKLHLIAGKAMEFSTSLYETSAQSLIQARCIFYPIDN